jgi:hypothetical protein
MANVFDFEIAAAKLNSQRRAVATGKGGGGDLSRGLDSHGGRDPTALLVRTLTLIEGGANRCQVIRGEWRVLDQGDDPIASASRGLIDAQHGPIVGVALVVGDGQQRFNEAVWQLRGHALTAGDDANRTLRAS